MKNKSKSFPNFIIPEIPNLIQIIGTTSIFGVLILKISFLGFIIPVLVHILLLVYLLHKSSLYLGDSELIYKNGWNYKILLVGITSIIFTITILIKAS